MKTNRAKSVEIIYLESTPMGWQETTKDDSRKIAWETTHRCTGRWTRKTVCYE